MFIHENQLCHLLQPAHYYDPRQHDMEVERLFRPSWHLVATTAELPRHGDFLTTTLLGQPLMVRNIEGQIYAYLNVCAHRHTLLSSKPCGHDPLFRCQYHGWEYDKEGRTGRIPEARCFRPWDRENARLHRYRAETCGELVFVSLADEGPSLAEFFGPLWDHAQEAFAPPYQLSWSWELNHACNWKVITENGLESYHVPCLHAKTFGKYPEEEKCKHRLSENCSSFYTPAPDDFGSTIQRWLTRRLGRTPRETYTHHHIYPHTSLASMDVFCVLQQFLPASPTTCRHIIRAYSLSGTSRWNPWTRFLAGVLRRAVKRMTRKILLEDAVQFPDTQRGLQSSNHAGVIGTREERVYAFQEYLLRACGETNGAATLPDGRHA